jgi:hypothetical protein
MSCLIFCERLCYKTYGIKKHLKKSNYSKAYSSLFFNRVLGDFSLVTLCGLLLEARQLDNLLFVTIQLWRS